MDYYDKKLYLPQVDKNNKIIGQVERWHAHKKGVLHQGFTLCLMFKNKYIVQQRKHPVFDGYFDLSFSSHQVFINNKLQTISQAINQSFKREWKTSFSYQIKPKLISKYYYHEKDPNSKYQEKEINHFYIAKINQLPQFNSLFAYGMFLLDKKTLKNKNFPIYNHFAPWAKIVISTL